MTLGSKHNAHYPNDENDWAIQTMQNPRYLGGLSDGRGSCYLFADF